jgi:glycosyltransferase involved in cell wall biosynthesis
MQRRRVSLKQFAGPIRTESIELSVVCAMRNVAHCVEVFLDSYRRERCFDTQLVVMDAASTDGTWEILLRNRDIIDYAVSEGDRGIYDAWNKALPICLGRYVSFIGADDRIAPRGIEQLTEHCRRSDHGTHVIAGFNILTADSIPVGLLGAPYVAKRLTRIMMLAQVMSAHRLSWLRSVSGFDSSYRSSGDYELLLRERKSLRVEVLPAILAFMEDGGTSRQSLVPHFENYRARRSNGVPPWFCVALLCKALAGSVVRRLGLKR